MEKTIWKILKEWKEWTNEYAAAALIKWFNFFWTKAEDLTISKVNKVNDILFK